MRKIDYFFTKIPIIPTAVEVLFFTLKLIGGINQPLFLCVLWLTNLEFLINCVEDNSERSSTLYWVGYFLKSENPFLVAPMVWFFVYVLIQTKLDGFTQCRISKFVFEKKLLLIENGLRNGFHSSDHYVSCYAPSSRSSL